MLESVNQTISRLIVDVQSLILPSSKAALQTKQTPPPSQEVVVDEFEQAAQNTAKQIAERPVQKNMAVVCQSCNTSEQLATKEAQSEIETLIKTLTQETQQEQSRPKTEAQNLPQQQKTFARFQESAPKLLTQQAPSKDDAAQPATKQDVQNNKLTDQNNKSTELLRQMTDAAKQNQSQQQNKTLFQDVRSQLQANTPTSASESPQTNLPAHLSSSKAGASEQIKQHEESPLLRQGFSQLSGALASGQSHSASHQTGFSGKFSQVVAQFLSGVLLRSNSLMGSRVSQTSTIKNSTSSGGVRVLAHTASKIMDASKIASLSSLIYQAKTGVQNLARAAGHALLSKSQAVLTNVLKMTHNFQSGVVRAYSKVMSLPVALKNLVMPSLEKMSTELRQLASSVSRLLTNVQAKILERVLKINHWMAQTLAKAVGVISLTVKSSVGRMMQEIKSSSRVVFDKVQFLTSHILAFEKVMSEKIASYWKEIRKKFSKKKKVRPKMDLTEEDTNSWEESPVYHH